MVQSTWNQVNNNADDENAFSSHYLQQWEGHFEMLCNVEVPAQRKQPINNRDYMYWITWTATEMSKLKNQIDIVLAFKSTWGRVTNN